LGSVLGGLASQRLLAAVAEEKEPSQQQGIHK
jgi:hypothetical protein